MATCEILNCEKYAARELCRQHGKAVREGRIPPQKHWYTQPNPPCSQEGCTRLSDSKKEPVLCGVHRTYRNEGRPIEDVRRKRRNGEERAKCLKKGCEEKSKTKGLCSRHYTPPGRTWKWDKCTLSGCETRTPYPHCKEHRKETETVPLRQVNCEVERCHRKFKTQKSTMCTTHRSDMRRKGVTREQYLSLAQMQTCQSCGSEDRIITDHLHGHHDRKDEMCDKCIRGRLCSPCNTALGLLQEEPERMRQLARYIENFPAGGLL